MAQPRFELRNHPAQARDPITGRPLVNKDGKPVPLFPHDRAIYFDGVLMGYCGDTAGRPITLIRAYPHEICEECREFVASQVGEPAPVIGQPPQMVSDEDDSEPEDEDDEDEDE